MLRLKVVFVFIISFRITFSFSQEKMYEYVPFPNSNAIWSEVYYSNEDVNLYPPSYERFILNGEDTVINAHAYKKLYMFLDTIFDKHTATFVGGIREDSDKKVWFKVEKQIHPYKPYTPKGNDGILLNDEILLYDFSVNTGDTIKEGNFDVFFQDGIVPEETAVVVERIDTVKIGDSYRKKIQFKPAWVGEWVEGIGSTQGLFATLRVALPTCFCEKSILIGFKHQNEILYFDEHFSEFYPAVVQPIENQHNKITVQQNHDRTIQFDFGNYNLSDLWIYDTTGRLQQHYYINGQSKLLLPTNHFASGVYVYKVVNLAGNSYTGKFITK